jgi:hypothetical protein
MPGISHRRALALAGHDPLVRRHLALVAFALEWSGSTADEHELVRHLDPFALESLAHDRLDTQTGALVLRYLGALDRAQCRALAGARNRLEAELGL